MFEVSITFLVFPISNPNTLGVCHAQDSVLGSLSDPELDRIGVPALQGFINYLKKQNVYKYVHKFKNNSETLVTGK